MDDFLQTIYLEEAKRQCEACFAAVHAFNAALASIGRDDPFPHAMMSIHHAASVSRIFWPPGSRDRNARQRAQRRGQFLRTALDIRTKHPIQDRRLRDHFEHFDERLDDWAERSKHRNIMYTFIGPRSGIGGNAFEDGDIIHHYDPVTKTYAFRGEKFDIQAIVSGIDDLYAKIQQRLAEIEVNRFGRGLPS